MPGLALAPMLARTGDEVEVVERERAWRPAGTGMYLPGNTARVLRAFGLEAQVASRAVAIAHQRFYDHHGRLLCEVDVAQLWAAVGPCLAAHRAVLHESSARRRVRCRSESGWPSSASLSATARSPSASATERAARTISWSGGRDPQRGAPAGVRADSGAPPRGPDRLALPGAPTPRGHDMVGDAGAPHSVPDGPYRRRLRVLLLRCRLTPSPRHARTSRDSTARRPVLGIRGSRRDAARGAGRRSRHPRLDDQGGR